MSAGDRRTDMAPGAVGWEPRYASLDVWRGLACLLVVVYHAGQTLGWSEAEGSWPRWLIVGTLRHMNLGVSLFFVISGYCIAASAEATGRRGDAPGAFMSRRFWRIYPPYWVALLGFAAVVVALDAVGLDQLHLGRRGVEIDVPGALDWRQWLGNLTLTETWRPHFWGPDRNIYTAVAWSLCFEEQFYLICFLALWLMPDRLVAALGSATVVIAVVRVYAWGTDRLDALSGAFPLLWHEFAVGLAVYYRLVRARSTWEKRLIEGGLVALAAVGLLAEGLETATASLFGLALIALRGQDTLVARLTPLGAAGRRCYSLYLVHLPAVVVGSRWLYELGLTGFWERALIIMPLVSAAGVGLGWLFHAAVEAHFLNAPPGRLRMPAWVSIRRGRDMSRPAVRRIDLAAAHDNS